MNLREFRYSALVDQPPADLNLALSGLWWDAKGDWTRAHESAQHDEGPLVPGYMHTYTVRKAIRRPLRIGISVRVSLRAAVRSRTSGLQLRKPSSADLPRNAAVTRSTFVELWPSNYH